jgi:4-alpha-glucanotransferase
MEHPADAAQLVRERASAMGVSVGFHDGTGRWHDVSEATLATISEALGEPAVDTAWPAVLVVQRGRPQGWTPPPGECVQVVLESGEERTMPTSLPGELPDGYHRLVGRTGSTQLVVAPQSCYLPPLLARGGRAWGWAVQIYALQSRTSWGIGDLGDLAALADDASLRGDFTLISPLNAPPAASHPGLYRPSSRMFRNPIYLDVEQIPERRALSGPARERFEQLAAAGRQLTAQDVIDRPRVLEIKDQALRLCFAAIDELPARRSAFRSWRASAPMVDKFAMFRALQGELGDDWHSWPSAYRRSAGPELKDFFSRHIDEVGYHAWLQWLLENQLASVPGGDIGVINDFPIGVARSGFDAWVFQDEIARGVTVGAPPDAFALGGQDWGQCTFSPVRLTATAYDPFIRSLRAAMTSAGGLRLDHAMGLSRLFLIPEGAEPTEGTYVRFPFEDLLGIVSLESHRARALVIGEDLGTVESGVRDRLAASKVLSSRVVWFERDTRDQGQPRPAADYPQLAMASVATHDLATVAGMFSDEDLYEQRDLGLVPAHRFAAALEASHSWQQQLLGLLQREDLLQEACQDIGSVVSALHLFLVRTPSMLVAVRLEDALEVPTRVNMPGTSRRQRPRNWSSPLPTLLENLPDDERVACLVEALRSLLGFR